MRVDTPTHSKKDKDIKSNIIHNYLKSGVKKNKRLSSSLKNIVYQTRNSLLQSQKEKTYNKRFDDFQREENYDLLTISSYCSEKRQINEKVRVSQLKNMRLSNSEQADSRKSLNNLMRPSLAVMSSVASATKPTAVIRAI